MARRTWGYFARFVNEETSWLPPDNYQISHRERVAMRTSPTNIAMSLLGSLAAHDFGYLTGDQLIERLTRAMATIGRLERHAGHLLNWYDLGTLSPLEPRYVSAVDSGNLLAALWALRHGLEEMIRSPLLTPAAVAGLRDTLDVVREEADGALALPPPALRQSLDSPPSDAAGLLRTLRAMVGPIQKLTDDARQASTTGLSMAESPPNLDDRHPERSLPRAEPRGRVPGMKTPRPRPGTLQLRSACPCLGPMRSNSQLAAWIQLSDRYLTWIEILREQTSEALAALGDETLSAIRADLAAAPSLERPGARRGAQPGLAAPHQGSGARPGSLARPPDR